MKRLLTLAAALLVMGASAFAQGQPAPKKHKVNREAEKIGFLTQKLDLTPEEAQVFWPVYNQYAKEAKECQKAVRQARKALRPGKDQPAYTEVQAKTAIDTFVKAVEAEKALLAKYNPKFLKVLPAPKVAKLYVAEEQYRNKMLKNLYKHQNKKSAKNGAKPCGHQGKPVQKPAEE